MIIGGIQWMTLLDYPDRVAALAFTAGCNFRCPFCHNPELVLPHLVSRADRVHEESFFDELAERAGFLEAVVITGGEPTLQPDLLRVMKRIKDLGFLVKLDTNGASPDVLRRVLETGLADFVAMDIKAPLDNYDRMAGVPVDHAAVGQSVSLIQQMAPQYEFRTTAAPGLHGDDLLQIADWLNGSRAYWLQVFRVPSEKGLVDENCRTLSALGRNDLETTWEKLRDRFPMGGVRG